MTSDVSTRTWISSVRVRKSSFPTTSRCRPGRTSKRAWPTLSVARSAPSRRMRAPGRGWSSAHAVTVTRTGSCAAAGGARRAASESRIRNGLYIGVVIE